MFIGARAADPAGTINLRSVQGGIAKQRLLARERPVRSDASIAIQPSWWHHPWSLGGCRHGALGLPGRRMWTELKTRRKRSVSDAVTVSIGAHRLQIKKLLG